MSQQQQQPPATTPWDLNKEILLVALTEPPRTEWIDQISARYPGLEVRWYKTTDSEGVWRGYEGDQHQPPDSSGSNNTAEDEEKRKKRKEQEIHKIWDGVTMLCCNSMPPPASLIPRVRFVQLASAGADKWLGHEKYLNKEEDGGAAIMCTANGVHPPQIAEWVIGTWLSHQHHFPHYAAQQQQEVWDKRRDLTVRDSTVCRMGILGYGAIGRQCARLASAMGMEVYAYTRSARPTAESRLDDSYCVPGTGDPEGRIPIRWFHGPTRADINAFLAEGFDILVVSLPLTDETRGLLSEEQFEILGGGGGGGGRKKTFVSNIARGAHIDTDALLRALEKGLIRGAALDVTDPEPLPKGHPLWKAPNVFITPHVSWKTHDYWGRALGVLEVNLEHLVKGEKPINLMNRELHY